MFEATVHEVWTVPQRWLTQKEFSALTFEQQIDYIKEFCEKQPTTEESVVFEFTNGQFQGMPI